MLMTILIFLALLVTAVGMVIFGSLALIHALDNDQPRTPDNNYEI